MGWAIGYDESTCRDIGYGVPCMCDQPGCNKRIHRGLAYVCGGEPYGGERGCGLYFCGEHQCCDAQLCDRCEAGEAPYPGKPDVREWLRHKLKDKSWQRWRDENPAEVENIKMQLAPSETSQ